MESRCCRLIEYCKSWTRKLYKLWYAGRIITDRFAKESFVPSGFLGFARCRKSSNKSTCKQKYGIVGCRSIIILIMSQIDLCRPLLAGRHLSLIVDKFECCMNREQILLLYEIFFMTW